MPDIALVACLCTSSRTFMSFLKYGEARDIPTSSLGCTSPLYKRLMTLGEQLEIVHLISHMAELAPAADLLESVLNLSSLAIVTSRSFTEESGWPKKK